MFTITTTEEKPQEVLTVPQVAAVLQVHEHTVYRLIAAGRLKSVKLGRRLIRIRASALDEFLEERHP